MSSSVIRQLRDEYHRRILRNVLRFEERKQAWNNTDSGSRDSIKISAAMVDIILANTGEVAGTSKRLVQNVGKQFEDATMWFLRESFARISHLRPGQWHFDQGGKIANFDQYAHLRAIAEELKNKPTLRAAWGDYIVTPDIVMSRAPESDGAINNRKNIIGDGKDVAEETPLRERNSQSLILHASISCKWTLRSDRAQNVRTEGLNLIRNRKGGTPRVVVVTGEPLPSRMTPLAFGTGDIDCVYHFALNELKESAKDSEMLKTLVGGRRLRDISDLVFDLAI